MIQNAKIKYTSLMPGENGKIIYQIGFSAEGGEYDTGKKEAEPGMIGMILSVLDLQRWEDLPRKFARIKTEGSKIVAFGNLLEGRWVSVNVDR